jgi:SAM-dependent methyltransferase
MKRRPWIDLGCGRRPTPGTFGLDTVTLPGVDVVARLDARYLPFATGTVEGAYALNVLEHLDDLPAVMTEIHRVLAHGALLWVEVPYFSSPRAWADPTHRRAFTYTTFEHFRRSGGSGWRQEQHTWLAGAAFDIVHRRLIFGRAHRLVGVAWLANRFPLLYENFLAYVLPARALRVWLRPSAAV